MKELIPFTAILFCFINTVNAQLPSVANALYNEADVQDHHRVQFAIDRGAELIATKDGRSFYIKWFPPGKDPKTTPVIVTLHGSEGFAFHQFFNWYEKALQHDCGIIALQWFRGKNAAGPASYFTDSSIYTYIHEALASIGYPSGKAFLHGFSRGAARSYAVILEDIKSGNNYFCTILSDAGSANPGYPLYRDISNGIYGNNVFNGKHWNLFCGRPNSNQSGCPAMNNTKQWLQANGAIIDLFIQNEQMGHNGLHLKTTAASAYKDSFLNNYINQFKK